MSDSNGIGSDTKREIRELGAALEEAEQLSKQLANINKKIELHKNSLLSTLGIGNWSIKGWLCQIEEKITKGRVSTSWKAVAEGTKDTFNNTESDLIEKYPEQEAIIHKIFKKFNKYYLSSVEDNTKPPEDKVNTVVSVVRLSE